MGIVKILFTIIVWWVLISLAVGVLWCLWCIFIGKTNKTGLPDMEDVPRYRYMNGYYYLENSEKQKKEGKC